MRERGVKKRRVNFLAKWLIFTVIILLALLFIMGYIWRILTTSDYFQVKGIVSQGSLAQDFSYLKGRNIFTLNLPAESLNIARACPDCSRIRMARILPDRIFVEFVRRAPVAFIKLYRYFAVDEDGVIFYSVTQPLDSGLPVIFGLETKIFGIKAGSRYENKELTLALAIVKETRKNRLLNEYKIQNIYVAGVDNITVQIPLFQAPDASGVLNVPQNEFLEVKISQGNIRDKIAVMAGLINQEKRNLANIKYIDLRFGEPVIKFKDAK